MSTRPVITIFGVTGAQGGGLARAILADPSRSFAVRAVTAKSGPAALALAAVGAEIAPADLDDVASLEHAMHGTYGVFAVTSAWEHFPSQRELVQASHILRAARRVNARHVIWSSLEDTCDCAPLHESRLPILMQGYKVPRRDDKDGAETSLRDLPLTLLRTSFFWDNMLRYDMGLQRAPDGVLSFALPIGDRPLAGIAAADMGPCALSIFQCCGQFIGRTVGIAGDLLSGGAMAEALAQAVGEPVRHVPMSFSDYAQLGFPGAVELANMFRHQHDFDVENCVARSIGSTRDLYPGLMGFEQWLDVNVESLRMLSGRATETINSQQESTDLRRPSRQSSAGHRGA